MDLVFNLKKMIIQLKHRMKHHLHPIGQQQHQQVDQHRQHRIDNLKLEIMLLHHHDNHKTNSFVLCIKKTNIFSFFLYYIFSAVYYVQAKFFFLVIHHVKYNYHLKISSRLIGIDVQRQRSTNFLERIVLFKQIRFNI